MQAAFAFVLVVAHTIGFVPISSREPTAKKEPKRKFARTMTPGKPVVSKESPSEIRRGHTKIHEVLPRFCPLGRRCRKTIDRVGTETKSKRVDWVFRFLTGIEAGPHKRPDPNSRKVYPYLVCTCTCFGDHTRKKNSKKKVLVRVIKETKGEREFRKL